MNSYAVIVPTAGPDFSSQLYTSIHRVIPTKRQNEITVFLKTFKTGRVL